MRQYLVYPATMGPPTDVDEVAPPPPPAPTGAPEDHPPAPVRRPPGRHPSTMPFSMAEPESANPPAPAPVFDAGAMPGADAALRAAALRRARRQHLANSSMVGAFILPEFAPEIITADEWFTELSRPQRRRPRALYVPGSVQLEVTLIPEDAAATTLRAWEGPWRSPARRVPARHRAPCVAFEIDSALRPELLDHGDWLPALAQPPRPRRRATGEPLGRLQLDQGQAGETVNPDDWYSPLARPPGRRPRLNAAATRIAQGDCVLLVPSLFAVSIVIRSRRGMLKAGLSSTKEM